MNAIALHPEWTEIMPVRCDDGLVWCVTIERAVKLPSETTIGNFFATEKEAREEAALWKLPIHIVDLKDAGRMSGTITAIVAG